MTGIAEDPGAALALEFQNFRTFIDTFAANVSQSGMFLEVAGTRSPGSEIEFDLRLEDGDSLIRGQGEVAWVLGSEGSDAAGMGIRFLDLAPESERLIERIVDVRTKAGKRLFDLEQEAPPEAQAGARGAPPDAPEPRADNASEDGITDRLRAQIESLKRERAGEQERFKAELEAARAGAKLLERRLEEQAAEIRNWSEQGKQARTDRERLEADQGALTEGLEVAQAEIERLVTENKAFRDSTSQLEGVKRSLAEKQASEEALQGQFEAAQAEIERLVTENKVLVDSADRLEEVERSLAEKQTAEQALQGQLEAALAEVARLETESKALRDSADQLEEVKESLATARAAEEALQEELTASRSAVEQTEQKARETESQLRSGLKEMEESRAHLREQLEKGQTELDESRRQFEESAERTLELEHKTSSLESKLAEAREEIDRLGSKTVAIGAETEELRSQRDALELELAARTKIAKKASQLSRRARAEHGRLQEVLAEAQGAIAKILEEERRLEHELEEESAEIQRAVDSVAQEPASETPAEMVASEIPTAEEPEPPRQSGLWAAIARTLGHPAGQEHEMAAEVQVDAEEHRPEAVTAEG